MSVVRPNSLFTDYDIYLLKAGKHFRLHDCLGSHLCQKNKKWGVQFGVWAPNAQYVSVVGEFNDWNMESHPLIPRKDNTGIWEGFIPELNHGKVYKYYIKSRNGLKLYKGDPYARKWEHPPETASIVWDTSYQWKDDKWMKDRHHRNSLQTPMSVYEVHLGSWKKPREEELSFYSYEEIASKLVPYVKEMGFTHIELMPVMEHPYYPSWGYQIHGYFAPSARFGDPQGLMYLIDQCHQSEIGVILDWVPSHFPADIHGLFKFDGTSLYEHEDPRLGYHPEWNSYIFNYGRHEVKSFLISNALYWFEYYHIDGMRVDALASMLFLDYAREEGQWIPNKYGGNENLEAIQFIKELNTEVYRCFPDVQMIAEDSTAYPQVSRPIYSGGLGFGLKWMMGWMNDTLKYFKQDPIYRKFHHGQITFSIVYAWTENFMLPLSHDEVVHGKASLLLRMPGDDWQKFANLRVLLGYMFTHPGSKLLFMGAELAQMREWAHQRSLDWHLLEHISHRGVQQWVRDLNHLYTSRPALYELGYQPEGFEWLVVGDFQNSVLVYLRQGVKKTDRAIVFVNLTPVPREDYRAGIPDASQWTLALNSDDPKYWGSGYPVIQNVKSHATPSNGRAISISVQLPPLSVLVYVPTARRSSKTTVKQKTTRQRKTKDKA